MDWYSFLAGFLSCAVIVIIIVEIYRRVYK